MTYRILVTGSRSWTDEEMIEAALRDEYRRTRNLAGVNPAALFRDIVLVSGACPTGADRIAEKVWERQGLTVERHPAQWRPFGIYNPQAGKVRNAEMVALGADMCLAFIRNGSRGATHCADLAEKAGIATKRFLA